MAGKFIRLKLSNVRICWPKLFEVDEFQGKRKYSVGVLIEKDTPNHKALMSAIDEAVKAQYPTEAAVKLKKFRAAGVTKFPVKEWDGDDSGNTLMFTPKRDETRGKPKVVDRALQDIDPQAGIPFGGCYCNISCDVFAHTFQGGGLAFYLNGVQFVKEGPRLGGAGATDCAGDFEQLDPAPAKGNDAFGDEDIPF